MGIFSFLNKKLRCPNCGCKDNHKKSSRNDVSKDVEGMMHEIMANMPKDSLTYKTYKESLSDDFYSCVECAKVFSLSTATTWGKISDKHGEKTAIDEYKKSSKS
jgi:hypothetical protein